MEANPEAKPHQSSGCDSDNVIDTENNVGSSIRNLAGPDGSPAVDREVISWLLDSDPAIRWQVRSEITSATPDEISAERALVATTGWGARLLELQDPDGTWGGGLYGPKWTSTTYTLLLLRRSGLDRDNSHARHGVERIWYGAVTHSELSVFTAGKTPKGGADPIVERHLW